MPALPQIKNKGAQPAKAASQQSENEPTVQKIEVGKNTRPESVSGLSISNETWRLQRKHSSIGTPFNFSPNLKNKLKMKKFRRTEMGNYTKN